MPPGSGCNNSRSRGMLLERYRSRHSRSGGRMALNSTRGNQLDPCRDIRIRHPPVGPGGLHRPSVRADDRAGHLVARAHGPEVRCARRLRRCRPAAAARRRVPPGSMPAAGATAGSRPHSRPAPRPSALHKESLELAGPVRRCSPPDSSSGSHRTTSPRRPVAPGRLVDAGGVGSGYRLQLA